MKNNSKEKSIFSVNPKTLRRTSLSRKITHGILRNLLDMRRNALLKMIESDVDCKSPVVDMGCNQGYLTRPLSLKHNVIGLDVDKHVLRYAKRCNKHVDFICCDLSHLPLRKSSVNTAICASVFEHLENLSKAIADLKFVFKKKGKLFAGYPIETRVLEILIGLFFWGGPETKVWDQKNLLKHKDRLQDPETHKQNYLEIRKMLKEGFSLLKFQKIPFNFLPDLLSIYEHAVLEKNDI